MRISVRDAVCAIAFICLPSVAYSSDVCDFPRINDTLELYGPAGRVGTLFETIVKNDTSGVITETTRLEARIADEVGGSGEQELRIEQERSFGSDGLLVSARQAMIGPSGVNTWELARRNGNWVIRQTIAGVVSEQKAAGEVRESIDNVCRMYDGIRRKRLRVGDTWTDSSFDLTSSQMIPSRITCRAVPSKANDWLWEFSISDALTGREETWMCDTSGRTVLRSLPPFFEARAPGFDAKKSLLGGSSRPLTEILAVPVATAPRAGRQIRVWFDSGVSMPESGRHFYAGEPSGRWRLESPAIVCKYREPWISEPGDSSRATPILQADHPSIRMLADSLALDTMDICELVGVFNSHVYRRIEKRTTATFSSALETLQAGFGDCGEHSVLLAALLRARRVPAQVVMGLVYVEKSRAYLGHAWVAVPLDGRWYFADPSFGLFPASTGLIPLLIDNTGQGGIEILKLIGRIHIAEK